MVLTILLSFFIKAQADQIKVAVLDTGIKASELYKFKVCDQGMKDFTNTGMEDTNGHGTNVAEIILKYNQNPNVCFMFLKVFSDEATQYNTMQAQVYAMEHDVKVINYSGGNNTADPLEKELLDMYFKKKGVFIAAVGNKHEDLDKNCNYYPACYDKRIFTVSNGKYYSNILKTSTKMVYDGEPGSKFHGTSQSTARATADFLTYAMKNNPWK